MPLRPLFNQTDIPPLKVTLSTSKKYLKNLCWNWHSTLYVIWLLVGASIIQFLEQPYEKRNCENVKNIIRKENNNFYNQFFFDSEISNSLCAVMEDLIATKEFENKVFQTDIKKWVESDCDKQLYDKMVSSSVNTTDEVYDVRYLKEFDKTFGG